MKCSDISGLTGLFLAAFEFKCEALYAAATRSLLSFSKDVNKASRVSAQIAGAIYPAAAFIVPFYLKFESF